MPTAEPVVELPERIDGDAESLYVAHADSGATRQVGLKRAGGVDQPAQRRIVPGAWVNPPARQPAIIGEVGVPQRGHVPRRLSWGIRVPDVYLSEGSGPGLRYPGTSRSRGSGV